jgi:hypothetical protein
MPSDPAEGRSLSDQETSGATAVPCPICQAPKGARCRTLGAGLVCSLPHSTRVMAAEAHDLRAENERLREALASIAAGDDNGIAVATACAALADPSDEDGAS